jgi:hypothetical protein
VMTSDKFICKRSISVIFSGLDQSPFQTALVRGCCGPASRAQAKAFGNSASTSSTLFFGSKSP